MSILNVSMFKPQLDKVSVIRAVMPGKFVARMINFLYPRALDCSSFCLVSGGTSRTSKVKLSILVSKASCNRFFVSHSVPADVVASPSSSSSSSKTLLLIL